MASLFGFAILDVSQAQVDVQSDGTVKIGNLAKVRIGICQPDGREVSLHSLTELRLIDVFFLHILDDAGNIRIHLLSPPQIIHHVGYGDASPSGFIVTPLPTRYNYFFVKNRAAPHPPASARRPPGLP